MTRIRRTIVLGLTLALALITAAPAHAAPPRMETTHVGWHMQAQMLDGKPAGAIEGATARLVATDAGASVILRTHGLEPGHAYTLWYVVINNPEACAGTPCTGPDILLNPQVDAQVTFGAGTVTGNSGRATFAAHMPVGPVDGWLADRTFHNPRGAEYHFVINDHGPKLAAHMPGMIHTYRGGCSDDSPFPPIFPDTALADGEPGPNRCLLTQVAIFQP